MWQVVWSKHVQKQLAKLPGYIVDKFRAWAQAVEEEGMGEVRKVSGFHDEPLKGTRTGERSVRLSGSYRAIYVERKTGVIEVAEVMEVSKHEY